MCQTLWRLFKFCTVISFDWEHGQSKKSCSTCICAKINSATCMSHSSLVKKWSWTHSKINTSWFWWPSEDVKFTYLQSFTLQRTLWTDIFRSYFVFKTFWWTLGVKSSHSNDSHCEHPFRGSKMCGGATQVCLKDINLHFYNVHGVNVILLPFRGSHCEPLLRGSKEDSSETYREEKPTRHIADANWP